MPKIKIAMVAAVVCLWGSATSADDTATESDVQCLLVSMSMMQSQNAAIQGAGLMSVMY